jgi:hypothetical protein
VVHSDGLNHMVACGQLRETTGADHVLTRERRKGRGRERDDDATLFGWTGQGIRRDDII